MARHGYNLSTHIECEFCWEVYTGRPESGGVLFGSKAACPMCAPRIEGLAQVYRQEQYIRAHCPAGTPFAQWVLELRRRRLLGAQVAMLRDEDADWLRAARRRDAARTPYRLPDLRKH